MQVMPLSRHVGKAWISWVSQRPLCSVQRHLDRSDSLGDMCKSGYVHGSLLVPVRARLPVGCSTADNRVWSR